MGVQGLGFHNPSTLLIDIIKHLSGPKKICLKVEDIVFKFSQRIPNKMSSQYIILSSMFIFDLDTLYPYHIM